MALDGIVVSNIVHELDLLIKGGRIDKIYQPQKDEIVMTIRNNGVTHKLLLSANPSHPRLHITEIQRENPITAPMFSMVLRKHIAGSKITQIKQLGLEMGDMVERNLIIEIMGKHSNIILTDENQKILDSIKHITHETSSVREVLPGKKYILPPSQDKTNPLDENFESFVSKLRKTDGLKIFQFIYKTYTGISPFFASEICFCAGINGDDYTAQIDDIQCKNLYNTFSDVMDNIKNCNYSPEIITDNKKVIDFSAFESKQYSSLEKNKFDSISKLLESFYATKDNSYRIQQKAHDMRRVVINNLERCAKKKDIQLKTIRDTEDMEIWRLKGELLTANIYAVEKGMKNISVINYYDENMSEINIALDENLNPSENAQKYYNKYSKAKRTLSAIEIQKKQNDDEIEYLESVLTYIDSAENEAEINELKAELVSEGFMKNKNTSKNKGQKIKKVKPLHFISSDGYEIMVGRNNIQNDELTIKTARNSDMWLHTKNIPGSHVIIFTKGNTDIPDTTLLEAANLAAYYSKGKNDHNVAVDYTLRKNIKKPNGAKPGMVIYETNYTVYITADEEKVKSMKTAE